MPLVTLAPKSTQQSYSNLTPWVIPWVVPGWQPLGHTGGASCNTCSEIHTAKPFKSYSLANSLGGPWMATPWVILVMPLVTLAPKFTQQSRSNLTPWRFPGWFPGWSLDGSTWVILVMPLATLAPKSTQQSHSNLTPWVVPWAIPGWQHLGHTGDASCDTCSEIDKAKPLKSYSLGGPLGDHWMAAPGLYW